MIVEHGGVVLVCSQHCYRGAPMPVISIAIGSTRLDQSRRLPSRLGRVHPLFWFHCWELDLAALHNIHHMRETISIKMADDSSSKVNSPVEMPVASTAEPTEQHDQPAHTAEEADDTATEAGEVS